MKETLILVLHPINGLWLLRDTLNHHISTFSFRADAEKFAKDNGYRLQINIGGRVEWSN
jgi:hypothetical protein